jgi:hypothetical protein
MKVTWTAARERDSTSYATERPQADEGFSGKENDGAPGEIRTPGLLVRSRRVDFIGSYFSTT